MILITWPSYRWFSFLEKRKWMHLIRDSVKFLPKLSKIKGDKNFLKRGEVNHLHFNGSITGLSLRLLRHTWKGFHRFGTFFQFLKDIPWSRTKWFPKRHLFPGNSIISFCFVISYELRLAPLWVRSSRKSTSNMEWCRIRSWLWWLILECFFIGSILSLGRYCM